MVARPRPRRPFGADGVFFAITRGPAASRWGCGWLGRRCSRCCMGSVGRGAPALSSWTRAWAASGPMVVLGVHRSHDLEALQDDLASLSVLRAAAPHAATMIVAGAGTWTRAPSSSRRATFREIGSRQLEGGSWTSGRRGFGCPFLCTASSLRCRAAHTARIAFACRRGPRRHRSMGASLTPSSSAMSSRARSLARGRACPRTTFSCRGRPSS